MALHQFYNIFAWISVSLFGFSEFSFRLPAAIFGSLSVLTFYLLSRLIFDKKYAWLSCIIFSSSTFLAYLSQEGKEFTMIIALSSLCTILFTNAIKTNRSKYWLWYALLSAVGVYANFYFVFLPFAFLVYTVVFRIAGKIHPDIFKRSIVCVGIMLVIFFQLRSFSIPLRFAEVIKYTIIPPTIINPPTLILSHMSIPYSLLVVKILFWILFTVGIFWMIKKTHVIVFCLFVSLAAFMVFVWFMTRDFGARFFAFCMPLFWLTTLGGIVFLFHKIKPLAWVCALLLVAGGVHSNYFFYTQEGFDFKKTARYLEKKVKKGETIGLSIGCLPVHAYYPEKQRLKLTYTLDKLKSLRPKWYICIDTNLNIVQPEVKKFLHENNYKVIHKLVSEILSNQAILIFKKKGDKT
jgi:4-amino-4-deoxy-L-arabinose transferase-like glycosyltransferase